MLATVHMTLLTVQTVLGKGSVPNPHICISYVGNSNIQLFLFLPETAVVGLRVGVLAGNMFLLGPNLVSTSSTVTHIFSRPVNITGSSILVCTLSMRLNLPSSWSVVLSCGMCLPDTSVPPSQSWSSFPWAFPVQSYSTFHAQYMDPLSSYILQLDDFSSQDIFAVSTNSSTERRNNG